MASGASKRMACFNRTQDQGIFRPSYRNLCAQFLDSDNVPVLLMSATCCPVAIKAIMNNLKFKDKDVNILRGEIVCPEIPLSRINMTESLSLAWDLLQFFSPASIIPSKDLPPTLVYSGSQHATLTTLRVVKLARETPEEPLNGLSDGVRRYHEATGPKDKLDCVRDFALGLFSIICRTLALGLGQNWVWVRRVIHMGQADPSLVMQMLGQCGRNGKPGVGFILVEEIQSGGENTLF